MISITSFLEKWQPDKACVDDQWIQSESLCPTLAKDKSINERSDPRENGLTEEKNAILPPREIVHRDIEIMITIIASGASEPLVFPESEGARWMAQDGGSCLRLK